MKKNIILFIVFISLIFGVNISFGSTVENELDSFMMYSELYNFNQIDDMFHVLNTNHIWGIPGFSNESFDIIDSFYTATNNNYSKISYLYSEKDLNSDMLDKFYTNYKS